MPSGVSEVELNPFSPPIDKSVKKEYASIPDRYTAMGYNAAHRVALPFPGTLLLYACREELPIHIKSWCLDIEDTAMVQTENLTRHRCSVQRFEKAYMRHADFLKAHSKLDSRGDGGIINHHRICDLQEYHDLRL